jgi:hypothetical protein
LVTKTTLFKISSTDVLEQEAADERLDASKQSDEDFKNKYPFNLFSFISCLLKTLMKQFFKLKWFIFFFEKSLFILRRRCGEAGFCVSFISFSQLDKLEEINFSSADIWFRTCK